jgi:hypothetical protein
MSIGNQLVWLPHLGDVPGAILVSAYLSVASTRMACVHFHRYFPASAETGDPHRQLYQFSLAPLEID